MELSIPKNFDKDFDILSMAVANNSAQFAFSRFSDGELFVMMGQPVKMLPDRAVVGPRSWRTEYPIDDWKDFEPTNPEDQKFQQLLIDAFRHNQDNYFVGLSCRCCVGEANFRWQLNLLPKIDETKLSWANLWCNSHYIDFIKKVLPTWSNRKVVMIVNKNARLANLPLNIVHDFRIGPFCMRNDLNLIEDISNWIEENSIEEHLFLFAASSLSNVLIHHLFKNYPNNTYIDIGSTLNPLMPGIYSRRDYMNQLMTGVVSMRPCIW